MENTIALPPSITDWVIKKEKAYALLQAGYDSINRAGSALVSLNISVYGSEPRDRIGDVKKGINKDLWKKVFQESRLTTLMDDEARRKCPRGDNWG